MTYYELLQQGPTTYMPVLIISFAVTLFAYGAAPIIIAKTRKKPITKKRFNLLCYGINFFVMFLFVVFGGNASGAPYILWTGVFSSIGIKTLRNRGILDGGQSVKTRPPGRLKSHQPVAAVGNNIQTDEIRFCRKCGTKLLDGARFCNQCGTAIIKEG